MNAATAHAKVAAIVGRRTMTEREIDNAAKAAGFSELETYLAHAYRNAAIAGRCYR